MIRLFFSRGSVFGPGADLEIEEPFYRLTLVRRGEILAEMKTVILESLQAMPAGKNHEGRELGFVRMDVYVRGVARFNETVPDDEQVRVLLALVCRPPRPIINTPSTRSLRYLGHDFDFRELWELYMNLETALIVETVRRYSPGSALGERLVDVVNSLELINEPDYHWIPEEMRIERSSDPGAYPLGKYVTEIHWKAIPTDDRINPAFEPTPIGFVEQDLEWEDDPGVTPVAAFRWGRKFDRYVACLAELHERLTRAAREEAKVHGKELILVSGAVTNNNIDYLMRMYRANPQVFEYVDAIGIHPYHWPRHDIWDDHFVSREPMTGWTNASPRSFALDYYKRFDFLEQIAALTALEDGESSYGLSGKTLWITEFGIPTKTLGKANTPIREYTRFIYERGEHRPDDLEAVIWEDLWASFFDQVTAVYLARHRVQAFLFFTLREGIGPDATDDDGSNLGLLELDGRPRLQEPVASRLVEFNRSLRALPAP